mgnify:CR=1 FL=1
MSPVRIITQGNYLDFDTFYKFFRKHDAYMYRIEVDQNVYNKSDTRSSFFDFVKERVLINTNRNRQFYTINVK